MHLPELTDKILDGWLASHVSPMCILYHETADPVSEAVLARLQAVAERYDDRVLFGHVRVDENPRVAPEQGIRAVPTVMTYRHGVGRFLFVEGDAKEDTLDMMIGKAVAA